MGRRQLAVVVLIILLMANVAVLSASVPNDGGARSSGVPELVQVVPVWQEVNSNGFGNPQTSEVSALAAFSGYLYAGTYNPVDGAQIFRSPDGVTWAAVTQPGFGISHDIAPFAILDLTVFNGRLYASTGRRNASQLWRTLNGVTWAPMDVTGFSDPDNVDLTALAEYGGMIYAGVTNQVTGAQIWRSYTGDNNTWTKVAPDVPGTVPASITGFAEFAFDGGLYAAVELEEGPAQIWRSFGSAWEIVVNDGFGDANTRLTGGIAEYLGDLYAGAGNTAVGAQLWHSADGDIWTQAITPGFGDSNNQQVESVYVFQNQLYVSVKNAVTGMEIWQSADGTTWEQANLDGFGDSNNSGTNRSNATAGFMGHLYVGTANAVDGGELWSMLEYAADLSIANMDDPDPVNTGSLLTYTLTITNAGPDLATTVTVTDRLPVEVTYGGASGAGWACGHAGGEVVCTRPDLGTGVAPAILITVTAPTSGGIITNTVEVSAQETDPDQGNNSAQATTQVRRAYYSYLPLVSR